MSSYAEAAPPVPQPRPAIDVSDLPLHAFDERAPLWWGNTLLLFIETTTLAILFATYFYLRMNFQQWPPPKVDVYPTIREPVPDLGAATLNALLLLGSVVPMVWVDRAARRMDKPKLLLGLAVMVAVSLLSLVLRWREFPATKFWWNDNAYASIVWTILGMAVIYMLGGLLEFFILTVWLLTHPLDESRALDATLMAVYWYWVAGTGFLIYLVVYWGPRVL